MRYILSSILLLAMGCAANGQKVDAAKVPAPVKSAFSTKFPKAENVKWEMEDKTDYEAEFTMSGTKWSAAYKPNGTWMETEHKISMQDLPEAVRKTIAAKYSDQKAEEVEQADTPSGTMYEVGFKKDGHETEVVFSADGQVMKSKVEEDEKEEDED